MCDENFKLTTSTNVLSIGLTSLPTDDTVINVQDNFNLTDLFLPLQHTNNVRRIVSNATGPGTITLEVRRESLEEFSEKLKGMNLAGCPRLSELSDELTIFFGEKITTSRLNRNFVNTGNVNFIYVTRSGFELITLAYNDAVNKQNNDSINYTKATLVLKSASTIGANTIISDQYIKAVAKHNPELPIDDLLDVVKTDMPSTFGIVEKDVIDARYNTTIMLTGFGYVGNPRQLGSLASAYDYMSNSIRALFNAPFSLLPISSMMGIFIDSNELSQLPNVSIYDQAWTVQMTLTNTNHEMAYEIYKSCLSKSKKEINQLNKPFTQELEGKPDEASKKDVFKRAVDHGYNLRLTASVVVNNEIDTKYDNFLLQTNLGHTITLGNYKSMATILTSVWKRATDFAVKAKNILIAGIKSATEIMDYVNKKYDISVDDIIDFLDNGPSAYVKKDPNKWTHQCKQTALNILPSICDYLRSKSNSGYNTDQLKFEVDKFVKEDKLLFETKSKMKPSPKLKYSIIKEHLK